MWMIKPITKNGHGKYKSKGERDQILKSCKEYGEGKKERMVVNMSINKFLNYHSAWVG